MRPQPLRLPLPRSAGYASLVAYLPFIRHLSRLFHRNGDFSILSAFKWWKLYCRWMKCDPETTSEREAAPHILAAQSQLFGHRTRAKLATSGLPRPLARSLHSNSSSPQISTLGCATILSQSFEAYKLAAGSEAGVRRVCDRRHSTKSFAWWLEHCHRPSAQRPCSACRMEVMR